MKHILLLAFMFALVFSTSAGTRQTAHFADSGVDAKAEDVEGVTIERQRVARLKPGYSFKRESRSSLSVLKTVREAAIQTGTLTCKGKRVCTVEIGGDFAKCSSGCYFVGVRGGILAQ